MALETLKGIKEIDGFKVNEHDRNLTGNQWSLIPEQDKYIDVNHERNSVTFKIQNGPVKENGLNGCQVDTIIETAILILKGLNQKYPCEENERAIVGLQVAIMALWERNQNRQLRGVQGLNKI